MPVAGILTENPHCPCKLGITKERESISNQGSSLKEEGWNQSALTRKVALLNGTSVEKS